MPPFHRPAADSAKCSLWHLAMDVIQKDERLEVMSKVARTDQASDEAMQLTGGAQNDLARCP